MTSKNSFWASIIENNKRRILEWMLSVFAFTLILPGYTVLKISKTTVWVSNSYHEQLTKDYVHKLLCDGTCEAIGFSLLITVLAIFFAWFTATSGFSYLYSKQQTDFYLGMPVKKSRRFATIWINGILIFILPYLIGFLISLGIAAGNGALDREVIQYVMTSFVVVIIFYLCIYHISLFTVMLTGNTTIQAILFALTFVYEMLPRLTMQAYETQFYANYLRGPSDSLLISPLYMFSRIWEGLMSEGVMEWKYVIGLVTITVMMLVIAYFCYKKRPAESVGKAIVFPILQPIIKIALVVLLSMMAGAATMYAIDFKFSNSTTGIGYVILIMAFAVILGCGAIQIVYEADGRGIWHQKKHMLISGLIVTMLFLIYRFDLTHYDSYVPRESEIESAAFVPIECELDMEGDSQYLNQNGEKISVLDYVDQFMYLTDSKCIHELARKSADSFAGELKGNISNYDKSRWVKAAVIYRLKNKQKVYRRLWIDLEDPQTIEIMNKIVGSQEFREGYFYVLSPMFQKILTSENYSLSITYQDMDGRRYVSKDNLEKFLGSYGDDVREIDYETMRNNLIDGKIIVVISKKTTNSRAEYSYISETEFDILQSFQHTNSALRENGFYHPGRALFTFN